jgi:sn-glycerol 3-phosphate transport system substrate-binding protein
MRLHRTFRAGAGAALAASTLAVITLTGPLAGTPVSAATSCSASAIPKGPTTITFWEGMTANNEKLIQSIVKAFNASQTKVHVNDVNQSGGYVQTWNSYLSSLGTSNEPNVVMLDQYITQGAIDSKSIIPVATCVAGTKYSTKTFAKKAILEETSAGRLQGLPYSVSAPILIYNQNVFKAAGIKSPPVTISQMAADAAKMKGKSFTYKSKKYTVSDGMTLKIDPWYLQILQGTANAYFVNNQNGRTGRATAAAYNDANGRATFTQLQSIVKKGDAVTNPSTGSQSVAYSNLFEIGYGKSGMTIDSSATLGTILADLPLFPNVKLGVSALPRITPTLTGGVEPGGNALFLPSYSNKSSAKLAASWEFMQYLDNAANMAKWDVGTGYVPIRSDAASQASMKAFYARYPSLKAAYTEIFTGKVDNATAGPLLGCYYQVSNDLVTAEDNLFSNSYPSPASVLSGAAAQTTSDIKTYNSSI